MTPQPPHHHHDPGPPGGPDPSGVVAPLIDLVPGDPQVPITVWRTARTPADAGRTIGARLAYRLVSAYSRPGEAVVDLTDHHALTATCVTGRRRHHPGWFTDVSSLIIGPATPPTRPADHTGTGPADGGGEPTESGDWFGDDLTDPDLPPAGAPPTPPDDAPLQGATSLVVASWPLDATDAANRVRLAWLLTAGARLLRPGGCLLLVVGVPAATPGTAVGPTTGTASATTVGPIPVGAAVGAAGPEDFGPLATAAATVGLGYLQHIVAVTADTDADAFVYHLTDEELLTLAHHGGRQWAVAHLRVHADLLVFSQTRIPAAATPSRRRPAGGRRG